MGCSATYREGLQASIDELPKYYICMSMPGQSNRNARKQQ